MVAHREFSSPIHPVENEKRCLALYIFHMQRVTGNTFPNLLYPLITEYIRENNMSKCPAAPVKESSGSCLQESNGRFARYKCSDDLVTKRLRL